MNKGFKIHIYVTIFWLIPIIGYYMLNNEIGKNVQIGLLMSYFVIHFVTWMICYLEDVYKS